jgi:hypothetical protein
MTNRITDKDLKYLVDRINEVTGSPMQAWTKQPDGSFKAQIGNYHLSHAYGGVCLHRMSNEGGGVHTPLFCGHRPKRELYEAMQAYLAGLEYREREAA